MAIVRKLQRMILDHGSRHTEATCTYSIIQESKGKSLQIDTYGSAHRKMLDKKSQSIRFSPEAIAQLREILSKEFKANGQTRRSGANREGQEVRE